MSDEPKSAPKSDDKSGKDTNQGNKAVNAGSTDIWSLEAAFPDVTGLLSSSMGISAANDDTLVLLDTNALLLPYRVGKEDLTEIEKAYASLIESGRLFVPARVLREFVKNRDGRLAEIVQSISDKSSSIKPASVDIPPLLNGLPETRALDTASAALKEARSTYLKAVEGLVEVIKQWRGNDPVTLMYQGHFTGDVVVQLDEEQGDGDRSKIEAEWKRRQTSKVPPGYKDAAKADTGIGDFLIWKVMLKLGEQRGKDLIFVTGEEKSDWFVRGGGVGLYPRPELVDEYRRASNGARLRISKLADVLDELKVSGDVVEEVRKAEEQANNAVISARTLQPTINIFAAPVASSVLVHAISFDYSTNDGILHLQTSIGHFELSFSKASDRSIYIIRTNECERIARAKNLSQGDLVSISSLDSTSRTYKVNLGDVFVVENLQSQILVGRITHIADDSRGAPADEVSFVYRAFDNGELPIAP
ncbi:MAG: PIN-like domain-containing protein [Rhizobium sp.]|nr:PIN-like domain-containing protein [Rhizobium sp.]MDM8015813.1 PIN-like domain-containing protein [Rhizobium sp.]